MAFPQKHSLPNSTPATDPVALLEALLLVLLLVKLEIELDEAIVEVDEAVVDASVVDKAMLDESMLDEEVLNCEAEEVDETTPNWYMLSLFDPPQYSVVFPLQGLSHPEAAGLPPNVS
ncbi:MAG: hypothetical protein Q9210_001707 [Variospora velana]